LIRITAEDSSIYNPPPPQPNEFVNVIYEFPNDEYYDLMAIIVPHFENNTHINNENTPYKIHDIGPQDYADIIFTDFQDTNELRQIVMNNND